MGTPGARPWPGDLAWGGDWLEETARGLATLGFDLREGSSPERIPGPRLLVALRPVPTLEHFDPELVTYWRAVGDRGRVAEITCGTATLPRSEPWSWGPIRVADRIPVRNEFLGFGGTLLVDAGDGDTVYCAFTSRAPIVRAAGHSQDPDPLEDEIGAFFARLMVPIDYQEGAEARVASAEPEALYTVFLEHSLRRFHRSHSLRTSEESVARFAEHESRRLQRDRPAQHQAGVALLDWLELP